MMIEIIKNGKVLKVGKTAFEQAFEPQGWKVLGVEEIKETTVKAEPKVIEQIQIIEKAPEQEEIKEQEEVEELVEETEEVENEAEEIEEEAETEEKPISEMDEKELKQYAKSLGIETDGLTIKATKRAIREKLSE